MTEMSNSGPLPAEQLLCIMSAVCIVTAQCELASDLARLF